MGYLLDTQVILWLFSEPGRVDENTRSLLQKPATQIFASVASVWEMQIKRALGKLVMPDDLEARLHSARIVPLSVQLPHVRALAALPPLHRDPFDRILVAQAQCEDLRLVTADPVLVRYPVATIQI